MNYLKNCQEKVTKFDRGREVLTLFFYTKLVYKKLGATRQHKDSFSACHYVRNFSKKPALINELLVHQYPLT